MGHFHNKQLWVLGAINTQSKEFRIELYYERNEDILKKFITTYIDTSNSIITDGWPEYLFLNTPDFGYIRYSHIHILGSLVLDSKVFTYRGTL